MKQVPSATFRKNYAKETAPVEVTAFGRVIGTWTPVGADIEAPPVNGNGDQSDSDPAPRMTIRPDKGYRRHLVAVEKPIHDPLELRRLEEGRSDLIGSRIFRRKSAEQG